MPAKRNVYTFKLVIAGSYNPQSPVKPDMIKNTISMFNGKPVYTVRSYENGEIQLSTVPVGEVLSVSVDDNLNTLALIALDANLNPTQFVLEPHYQIVDDTASPAYLVVTPVSDSFAYFMLLDEDMDKASEDVNIEV